ncbi:hypothetical protein AAIP55_002102 [Flavobacterium psychrophilum]|nr:hypothetical protein [Flavobacterium psychrophilum]EKT4517930.1 hypothetical protein [Flavobacterium psychrophilum]
MAGERKRIARSLSTEIHDPLEFTTNCSSDNVRLHSKQKHFKEVELWFDKHYFIRLQHGDENGKREGIDVQIVEKLIEKSLNHLISHSLRIEKFNFLNFPEHNSAPLKVILQELCEDSKMLNVATECHFIDISTYEITVKTAMVEEDFRIRDGQYLLEIIGKTSVLKRKVNNKIVDINEL